MPLRPLPVGSLKLAPAPTRSIRNFLGAGLAVAFLLGISLAGALLVRKAPTRGVEPRLSAEQAALPCLAGTPDLLVPRPRCPGGNDRGRFAARPPEREIRRGDLVSESAGEPDGPVAEDEILAALRALGKTDRAVQTLVRAAQKSPSDPRRLSDAAAALFVRAQTEQAPLPLLTAYRYAERATDHGPTYPPASFNRALIEETLGLFAQARTTWARYLALDSRSDWAEEARNHLAALAPDKSEETAWPMSRATLETAAEAGDAMTTLAIVERFPQKTREHLLESVLPAWGQAVVAADGAAANRLLRIARVAGQAVARVSGDFSAVDATAEIQARGAPVRSLARVFALYGQASRLVTARDFSGAEALLGPSGDLPCEKSTIPLETCFLRQRIAYQVDRFAEQRAVGRRLLAATADGRRPALRGRVLWSLGTTELLQGHPAEGVADYRAAEKEFARGHFRQHLASLRGLLAGAVSDVGELAVAWNLRLLALRDLATLGDPSRVRLAASAAAFAAEEAGEPAAARAFLAEALAAARLEDEPMPIARVLLHRAELAERTGSLDDAFRTLAEARRWSAKIASATDRRGLEIDLFFTEGRLLETRNPRAAVNRLSETLERFDLAGYRGLRPWALRSRAQALLAAGDDRGAERDLSEAIDLLERAQSSVPDSAQAIGYLDQVRAVYERMIALQVDLRRRPDRALDFAERGRARRLREQLLTARGALGSIGSEIPATGEKVLRAALAPGLTALVYQDLPDRLLIWKATREQLDLAQVSIARADLQIRIERARRAARRNAPEAQALLADLYDLLIRPIVPDDETDLDLLIVPSGSLWGVPFAALQDRRLQRFLVERATLRLSPSLSVYATPTASTSSRQGGRVLVVADPALDRSVFPLLPRLPGAHAEARAIADAFPQADILEGAAASPAELQRRLPEVSVLHLAAHAVADARSPFLSYLALAPGPSGGDSGVLYAKDLLGPSLLDLRLAVLSACNTLGNYTSESEGVLGLAWPFLARGARNVTASLWETRDRASADLFANFYAELAQGADPAKAFRKAQTLAIQSRVTVDGWGAFMMIEGAAGIEARTKSKRPKGV